MVTPIETKRESVRSDHRRGCYENGGEGSVFCPNLQFDELNSLVSPTRQMGELDSFGRSNSPNGRVGRLRSVQLAKWASWTACSIQLSRLEGWTVGVSLSGIRCPRPRATFLEDLSCESFSELLRNLT
ncbi:hypothetical protein DY000_02030933 [Brassica cretica]|uniref:Uncharacterized protein n=1 Tax=Brassica cretica TaxID=69181 RepID=A0ABQ7DD93_BRACR|nr:hypothetical protein DY000_02030933 [Brassica cretica]